MTFVRKKEDVWSYPRPPAIEHCPGLRLRVVWTSPSNESVTIADTTDAYRILETSHPPTWYFKKEDVRMDLLQKNPRQSYCEWKGKAAYYDFQAPGGAGTTVKGRIFEYPDANGTGGKYAAIKGYISFYATSATDPKTQGEWRAYIDDERVEPQPGDFYSGWVDQYVVGKVKGAPGTWGW